MVQDLIYIDFPNNPRHGDSFSYRINKNGTPVSYSGTGTNIVGKTYIDHQTATKNNMSVVGNTNIDDSTFIMGSGFQHNTQTPSVRCIVKGTYLGNTVYYVGGLFNSYNGTSLAQPNIVRLNSDGSLDTSFTPPAVFLGNGGAEFGVRDIAIQSDGKIIIVGNFTQTTGSKFSGVLRLNTNGSIDNRFGGGFYNQFSSGGPYTAANAFCVKIQSDGKILVGGAFNRVNTDGASSYSTRYSLVRFNTDGTLDTLNVSAKTTASGDNAAEVYAMDLDLAGANLVIGGNFAYINGTAKNYLAKINLSGTGNLVTGFSNATNDLVLSVKTNSAGNFWVGGYFTLVGSTGVGRFALVNGTTGAVVTGSYPSFNGIVRALALDASGNIIVGGEFTTVNGVASGQAVRVLASGSLDSTFTPYAYGGTTPRVQAAFVDGSRIFIGGRFTTFEGGAPTFTQTNIPIGSTINITRNNTIQSLSFFNSAAGVVYVESTNVIVQLDFTGSDTVIVDSLSDTTNYVEITLSNSALGISPIVVNTRSPHFVVTPFSGSTNAVKYSMRMFRGDFQDDVPTTVNYTITKGIIEANQNTFYINISKLTRDFITVDIDSFMNSSTTIQPMASNETVWVKLDTQLYSGTTQSSGTTVGTGTTVQYIALDGYGYPEEGMNPQPPKVLFSNDEVSMWREGQQRVYFNTNGLISITRSLSPDFTSPIIYTPDADTGLSTEYFESIRIDTMDTQGVVYYKFDYDTGVSKVIKFNLVDECKNDVKELYFKNKYGVLQAVSFFKRHDRKFTNERKTFERSTLTRQGSFNPRKHTTVTYMVNGDEELTLNSGYVKESMNQVFRELFDSDEVYINDDGVIKPVTLMDKDWTPKLGVNDKLINYQVKVRIAQNSINNIQ